MEVLSLDSLPLGFRFRPTDEELVHYYLRLKINGKNDEVRVIREIDVCKWEPWDLPDLSAIKTKDKEWFFFCPLDKKYPNGSRLNRATEAGYWKATGKDRRIKSGNNLIGMKKTLVFYTGRAPRGIRTSWVMHEYHPTEEELQGTLPGQCAFVLCKLFNKQDENNEGAKSGDIEPVFSSPDRVKSSPVNTPSELEFPERSRVSESEAGKLIEDPQDVVAADIHRRISDPCNVEDLVTEILGPEGDPQLGHDLEWLSCQSLGPLDCKIFSPLHSQMQVEIGTSSMFYSLNSELSNNNSGGMEFQYGTNYSDSTNPEFFDSILGNPQPYPFGEPPGLKNSVGGSEGQNSMATIKEIELSDTKGEINKPPSDNQEPPLEDEGCGTTGIRIRPRQLQSHNSKHNLELQGDAPRRLRLQQKLRRYSIDSERLQVKAEDHMDKEASETGNKEDIFGAKKISKLQKTSTSGDLWFRLKNIWSYQAVLIRIAVVAIILLISICSCKYFKVLN